MQVKTVSTEHRCKQCGSTYGTDFVTELCIHIPGAENLTVPAVFIFPVLEICLDCGAVSEFRISTKDLTELKRYLRRDSGSA